MSPLAILLARTGCSVRIAQPLSSDILRSGLTMLCPDLFKEHLPGHLVEYEPPTAGMFICVRVKVRESTFNHQGPSAHCNLARQAELHPTLSPIELLDAVFDRFIQNLVILTPSSVFHPAQEDGSPTPMSSKDVFFRASFSSASESDMEEGVRRMGRALRDVFGEKEAS